VEVFGALKSQNEYRQYLHAVAPFCPVPPRSRPADFLWRFSATKQSHPTLLNAHTNIRTQCKPRQSSYEYSVEVFDTMEVVDDIGVMVSMELVGVLD
jgi:hypothetical protein